jgi:23S rRNA A1618 N6-methylase RlmF
MDTSMDVSDEEDHDNNVVREGTLEQELSSSSSRKRQHRDSSSNNNNNNGENDSSISMTTNTKSLDILERSQNPNFEELARQYPKFRAAWAETKSIQKERTTTKGAKNNNTANANANANASSSFSSCVTQEFTIELTKALLSSQFRLKLAYLDEDHLCPPIPNRFFYLHWIHTQLLKIQWVVGERNTTTNNDSTTPRGLDIGSGAYCIYSMLAARFFRLTMITSEIDSKSVALANANVTANYLSNMITILQVLPSHSQQQRQQQQQQQQQQHNNSNTTSIGGPLQRSVEAYFHQQQQQQQQKQQNHNCSPLKLDFVMTNPPFYDPASMEISTARVGDGRSRTNMTVSEGNYPGGEIGFVTEMIEDSLRMTTTNTTSNEIQSTTMTTTTESDHNFTAGWYSSMLGKKTSIIKLQKLLVHILGPAHVEATEYGPGHYTRWFLAWTLERPPATASGALCPHSDKDHFQVDLFIEKREAAVGEVVNRIVSFCDTSPGGWDLTTTTTTNGEFCAIVRIQETMSPTITNFVDETQSDVEIPKSILQVLRGRRDNSRFLPDEGHFFVEIKIQVARSNNNFNTNSENQPMTVDVQLSCYRHSTRGAKAIEKIRCLDKDVQRTSRKWRRIRERQEKQQQQ